METLSVNKRARFDYEFLEKFEGGLVLTGAETKSAKAGHVQLKGSFVSARDGEYWLKGAHISPYKPAGPDPDYDPTRSRKILLRRAETQRLIGKSSEKGLTLVPIRLYTKNRLVKLEFALARGKKEFEKREKIKKQDLDRQMKRYSAKDI